MARGITTGMACLALWAACGSVAAEGVVRAGALDGLTFDTAMQVAENGATDESRFSFRDGQFYSVRCNAACDFGWTDYDSWEEDGATHFRVEMTCDEAPHRVIWQGRVEGDKVTGSGLWRTERWYWTVERNAVYEGALSATAAVLPDAEG